MPRFLLSMLWRNVIIFPKHIFFYHVYGAENLSFTQNCLREKPAKQGEVLMTYDRRTISETYLNSGNSCFISHKSFIKQGFRKIG